MIPEKKQHQFVGQSHTHNSCCWFFFFCFSKRRENNINDLFDRLLHPSVRSFVLYFSGYRCYDCCCLALTQKNLNISTTVFMFSPVMPTYKFYLFFFCFSSRIFFFLFFSAFGKRQHTRQKIHTDTHSLKKQIFLFYLFEQTKKPTNFTQLTK